MNETERAKLLTDKGWSCGSRNDGRFAIRDSSGEQIGVGDTPDAAVAKAVEYCTPPAAPKSKGAEKLEE